MAASSAMRASLLRPSWPSAAASTGRGRRGRLAGDHQNASLGHLSKRVVGIEADRDVRFLLGRGHFTLVIVCPCQHGMTHGVVGIQRNGGSPRCFRQFQTFPQRQTRAERCLRQMQLSQQGMWLREPRIQYRRPVQEVAREGDETATLLRPMP